MRSVRCKLSLVASGLATVLLAGSVGAEVGVPVDTELSLRGGLYQILMLSDDPDPYLGFWVDVTASHTPSRIALNTDGDVNGDGPPSVLMNPFSGLPTVAWARNSASGFDVVVSHFAAGAWSAPEVVAGGTDDELDPHLVLDPVDGTVHLFYWVDTATPVVMYRHAPADLSSWSSPVQVSNGIDAAFRPGGVVHNGVLKVVYEVHAFGSGQTPRDVILANWNGQSFVPQVLALSNHDGELWPRLHSHSGRMWLEWIDADDQMAWFRFENEAGWSPKQWESFATVEEREFHVRGAIRIKATQEP
jgi:hypothetical protein